jgi:hypothetical protein
MDVDVGNYVLDFAEFETNLWLILFYTIPLMVLLWQGVHGWRYGAKQKLVALGALVAGLAAAYYGGEYVGGLLPRGQPAHPFARDLVQAAIAGIGAYVVLRLLAIAVLFRGEQKAGSFDRFGGLLLGLGIASLWILAWGLTVRYVGNMLETTLFAATPEGGSPKESVEDNAPKQNVLVRAFLYWNKRARETGTDARIEQADPIPPDFYDTTRNLVLLSRNPDALGRLAANPKVREFLAEDSSIVKLYGDESIRDQVEQGRWLDLLRHPKVYSTLRDDAFLRRLGQSGLDEAIAEAVEQSQG